MKWNIFKREKGRKSRFAAGTRRVTGVVTELPAGVKFTLAIMVGLIVLTFSAWGGWTLFTAYYFRAQSLFVLRDLRRDVTITTGKTLTPDLVCEVLGLRDGVNLFSIPIDRKRRELLEQAPNIRDITIVRRMPDKLNITIVEREPIARIGSNGRVVDEEGVVFVRYAGTGGLPLIKGSGEFAQVKPGERLRGNEMAAVRLIGNTLRPECTLRLLAVDASKADYLLLTFSDYRQAKFAWGGMSDEQMKTQTLMQNHLDNLAKAMDSEIGRPRMMWNATLPGRIFAPQAGAQ
jgi:cell division septal protein FtsQ